MLKKLKNKLFPQTSDSNGIVNLVDELLADAVESDASDVHFEPGADGLAIKYRLDGLLKTVETLPAAISENVIARLKVLGGLLTYRNDIPQEGRIEIKKQFFTKVVDQRISIFPTIYGQRAVVRIFYQTRNLTELDQLGIEQHILSGLKFIAEQSQGLLLLTGPAGSGKSTTLAALLRYILKAQSGKSIVTLEDPVEIRINGVTQVQINPFGEMNFPTALRSLLRQDPQVLMIGEIRDAETAKIAIEAGLTGHLLMSTMHSGSPVGALIRLLEMGIEPYQITSSVSAVLNQRLVRKLCENCKQRNKSGRYEPRGCDKCFNTGFKGRVLVSEIVQLDGNLRKAVLEKADVETLDKLLDERGHMTMFHNGQKLISRSVTTEEELAKVCRKR